MNKPGRLSAILSGAAFVLLAVLLLLMKWGLGASDAVVMVIMWLVLFIIATLCAIAGIVIGFISVRKTGETLAGLGLWLGFLYLTIATILLLMLIEFVSWVRD